MTARPDSTYASSDPTFDELMASQLRRAPWFLISIALHAAILVAIALLPRSSALPPPPTVLSMQTPEKVEDIEDPPKPEEQVEDEIVPEDTPIDEVVHEPTETDAPTDAEFDAPAEADAPFDSTAWSTTVGLGGPAGGVYGNRGGGGPRGRRLAPHRPTIDRALRWLVAHQDDDGRWDADEFMKHDFEGVPCDGAGNSTHDVGVTGLALLAFLGDGHTMTRGAYSDTVSRAARWLRTQQDEESGLIGQPISNEFFYDHVIATLALTETCGLSRSKVLRKNVSRAIGYMEAHRNPYGAWRYQPRDTDADTSITGWCILAYKTAKDFDFPVNKQSIEYASEWLERMTDPATARTGYTDRGGLSSRHHGDHAARFPREKGECMTSVSLLCRVFLGHDRKSDPMIDQQAELVLRKPPVWDEGSGAIDHYAWYYATYALFQIGGTKWKKWSKAIGKAIVPTQRTDGNASGSWDPVGVWGDQGGRVYSTAILCLTAQAHGRYTRVLVR